MEAVDFVLYCLGGSMLGMATAVSIRLITPAPRGRAPVSKESAPRWEPVTDPSQDDLTGRLRDFQSARYASPLVRRQLNPEAGPIRREPAPTTRGQATPPPERPQRPWPLPRRPASVKGDGNVIPIPLKTKKNEEPPKEGA